MNTLAKKFGLAVGP